MFYARKQLAETVLYIADLNHPGPQWTYGYALDQFRQAVELGEKVLSEHDFDLESVRNNYEALANLLDVD